MFLACRCRSVGHWKSFLLIEAWVFEALVLRLGIYRPGVETGERHKFQLSVAIPQKETARDDTCGSLIPREFTQGWKWIMRALGRFMSCLGLKVGFPKASVIPYHVSSRFSVRPCRRKNPPDDPTNALKQKSSRSKHGGHGALLLPSVLLLLALSGGPLGSPWSLASRFLKPRACRGFFWGLGDFREGPGSRQANVGANDKPSKWLEGGAV